MLKVQNSVPANGVIHIVVCLSCSGLSYTPYQSGGKTILACPRVNIITNFLIKNDHHNSQSMNKNARSI